MKRILVSCMLLIVSAYTVADGWFPDWKKTEIPGITQVTYYEKDPDPPLNGEVVVWVFLAYEQPRSTRYFKGRKFKSEVQEWVLNCKSYKGGVATIRYTEEIDPFKIKKAGIVHPLGMKGPTSEQVRYVCDLIT